MWQRMAALSLAMLSGCVSAGEYQDLETKYQHQLAVKEVMETEHDELSQRVDNVSQVYRHVAQEQMGLKAQAEKLQGDILTVKGVVKDTQNQYESQRAQFAQHLSIPGATCGQGAAGSVPSDRRDDGRVSPPARGWQFRELSNRCALWMRQLRPAGDPRAAERRASCRILDSRRFAASVPDCDDPWWRWPRPRLPWHS